MAGGQERGATKPVSKGTRGLLSLPPGYSARALVADDLRVVAALIAACEVADEGSAESTLDDLRGEWELPRFDLARVQVSG